MLFSINNYYYLKLLSQYIAFGGFRYGSGHLANIHYILHSDQKHPKLGQKVYLILRSPHSLFVVIKLNQMKLWDDTHNTNAIWETDTLTISKLRRWWYNRFWLNHKTIIHTGHRHFTKRSFETLNSYWENKAYGFSNFGFVGNIQHVYFIGSIYKIFNFCQWEKKWKFGLLEVGVP